RNLHVSLLCCFLLLRRALSCILFLYTTLFRSVHGEFERNDMVEYFGEKFSGFLVTEFGWVQSYGSRCVKPPLIFGDVRGGLTQRDRKSTRLNSSHVSSSYAGF